MHPMRPFHRLMVVAAAAGALSVGVPHVVPGTPANAFSARTGWGDSRDDGRGSSHRDSSPDTTTATATCGNGLVVLGPIVVPVAPNTTTVIQCQEAPPASGSSR
jgi:hypothetical protein